MSLESEGMKKTIRHDDISRMPKPTFKLEKEAGGVTQWLMKMDHGGITSRLVEMDKFKNHNQE